MSTISPFYHHDSDARIMVKKNKLEVGDWTDSLEFFNKELEYLLAITKKILKSTELYRSLEILRRENQLLLGVLYRYENSMGNAEECDTTACDTYYLNNHEKYRDRYKVHLKKYNGTKQIILNKTIMQTK